MNNGLLAQQKKAEIELTGMQKARFDFEKKKLNKQIINYIKQIYSRRRYIEKWSREFIVMIAYFSIFTQISKRFSYLKAYHASCKRKMVATLFAVSRVKFSMESRGKTNEDRTVTESKM